MPKKIHLKFNEIDLLSGHLGKTEFSNESLKPYYINFARVK
jgi:hypothetical protein